MTMAYAIAGGHKTTGCPLPKNDGFTKLIRFNGEGTATYVSLIVNNSFDQAARAIEDEHAFHFGERPGVPRIYLAD